MPLMIRVIGLAGLFVVSNNTVAAQRLQGAMPMNRILTAVAAGKDAGRQVKYFVRGDMGVSYGQFTSLKGQHGLRVNGAPVHANHLLRPGDVVTVVLEDGPGDKSVAPEEGPAPVVPVRQPRSLLPGSLPQRGRSGTDQGLPKAGSRRSALLYPQLLPEPLPVPARQPLPGLPCKQ